MFGTLCLASMLGADFFAAVAYHRIQDRFLTLGAVIAIRVIGWTIAIVFLSLSFAVIYYWAPAVKKRAAGIGSPSAELSVSRDGSLPRLECVFTFISSTTTL